MDSWTRRLGGSAAALSSFVGSVNAQPQAGEALPPAQTASEGAEKAEPTELEKIFDGIKATDQTGKEADIAAIAKGQCIVVFGYGNCPVCSEITKTVAATQKKLLDKGIKDVPIVVISAQPEKDSENMAFYISGFQASGIKQFASENIDEKDKNREQIGKEMIGVAEKLPASDRLLHVLCPATAEDTQILQVRLAEFAKTATGIDPKNTKQHTPNLTLFDQGKVVIPGDGKGPIKGAAYNLKSDTFEAPAKLVSEQSDRMLKQVETRRRENAKEAVR